jgi:3-phenylpropionate/trans-cinnamate dioxygenase ferredoxin subunit
LPSINLVKTLTAKNYTWHKIADDVSEIPFGINHLTEIDVNNKTVCVSKHNDEYFACAHKCPHAGGRLADGYTDALGNIVCPLHRYKFDLHNGRNISGEGYYLKTYPIQVRPDGVFIGFEEKGLFSWLK